ncbi:hypothetical protein GS597_00630 [Synechococcales cyanobacterium C]|uniref:Uncharacterized protein n=1 Tax=Petrachloros mirabilis ULC683 TaxID=2781853 RepID=A0A8K1ZWP5_9CYAN|nr:hypothetical protein [Petrachloros mirabilis]NCJ05047.1 hypothetical protein [Petrachloros mirabilis ULC683]
MLSEAQQDGHLIYYPPALPKGLGKRLLHVNGVASPVDKQRRDLEALVWLSVEHPLDVVGVHNSTEGFQADILESLLAKSELYRLWPQHRTSESQERLQGYVALLKLLCDQSLSDQTDLLTLVQELSPKNGKTGTPPLKSGFPIDLSIMKQLPFMQQMGWAEFEAYAYGSYPTGAPRPTLRLAYEIVRAIRDGVEVFVTAHSQGMIIAALAFHIVAAFFEGYSKWTEPLRFIGYGPAIMFEDLPESVQSQTVMIQHRQDLVAESFSNVRHVSLWSNLQNYFKNLIDNANEIAQLVNTDSHHSASLYLGLTEEPSGTRSAQLIQLLLSEDWKTSTYVQSLRANRIILEATHL